MAINEQEWAALKMAEAKMYAGEYGAHAYTSVNDNGDPLLDALFANATMQANMTAEYDGLELTEEAARRVAACLAILAFGSGYGSVLGARL